MDYAFFLEKAIENISTIPSGQIFYAKDIFRGSEWKELKRGDKLGFGKFFKNAVIDGKVPSVEYHGKAENNSALYIKKGRDTN